MRTVAPRRRRVDRDLQDRVQGRGPAGSGTGQRSGAAGADPATGNQRRDRSGGGSPRQPAGGGDPAWPGARGRRRGCLQCQPGRDRTAAAGPGRLGSPALRAAAVTGGGPGGGGDLRLGRTALAAWHLRRGDRGGRPDRGARRPGRDRQARQRTGGHRGRGGRRAGRRRRSGEGQAVRHPRRGRSRITFH